MRCTLNLSLLLVIALVSYQNEIQEDFTHCEVNFCQGFQDGSYCLFGLKWGQDQIFEQAGIDVIGPQSSGGIITFSFVTESITISSGLNVGLQTVPFDNKENVQGVKQGQL